MCRHHHIRQSWTCEACQRTGRLTLHFPEERWTDHEGALAWGLGAHLSEPPILRCEGCSTLQRTGELEWDFESERPDQSPPSEADYLEAIERGFYETRLDKLDLRLRAWRASNDPSRVEGARAQIRSAEAQANLEALYELLCDDPSEALTKAEVARQLGRHAEALDLLGSLSRLARAQPAARAIARAASEGLDSVQKVSERDNFQGLYTCPSCERPGRLGFDHPGPGGYSCLSELSSIHALRCGSCQAVFWRGAHARSEENWLESFSNGAVAALGCLVFPLGVAVGVASEPAGLGILATYLCLLGASLVAGRLRRWRYPDSLPLRTADLERLVADEDWEGRQEERWARLALFSARLQAGRASLDANFRALIELVGPEDPLFEAELRQRAGDAAGARALAEQVKAAPSDAWQAQRASRLLGELASSKGIT